MIVDQDEIEALLAQAGSLVAEGEDEAAKPGAAQPPPAEQAPKLRVDVSPEIARVLRIRVPVIAQLTSRRMNIADVCKLSLGRIIEFNRNIDEPLDLLINNHPIGRGDAVKVNDHFGMRVSQIRDAATRIRSMGE